VPVSL